MKSKILKHAWAGMVVLTGSFLLSYWIGGEVGGAVMLIALFLAVYSNTIGPGVANGVILATVASEGGRSIAGCISLVLLLGLAGAGFLGWKIGVGGVMNWLNRVSTSLLSCPVDDAVSLAIAGLALGAILGVVGAIVDTEA